MLFDCSIHIHELIFVQKERNSKLNQSVLFINYPRIMCFFSTRSVERRHFAGAPFITENSNNMCMQTIFNLERVAFFGSNFA